MPWNTYICGDFDARRPFDIFENCHREKSESAAMWFKERENSVLIRTLCLFRPLITGNILPTIPEGEIAWNIRGINADFTSVKLLRTM